MRVLFVHSGNMYGGTERALETIARERDLCASLDPQFALCFQGRLADTLRQDRVPVEMLGRVRVLRPDLVLSARRRFAALLARTRPAVVVTQSAWSHAVFAPVARQLRLPLVWWVHDALTGRPWLERLAARTPPDFFIFNSHFTSNAAHAVFPNVAGVIIRCPLVFDPPLESRATTRRRHSTPDDATVIVNVARMDACKGHAGLLEALARMPSDKGWMCWLVGGAQRPAEERYERELRRRVEALGLHDRVRFMGQQRDVMSLLAAADIYCQPNDGPETFGLAMVEALHAGLPVVATGLGGALEIVTGACGRLVSARDSDALAAALTWLVDNSDARAELGANGPSRAWALCNPAARLEELAAALHGALHGAAA